MMSLYSVIVTLVLFSEFGTHSLSLAIPTGKLEEGRTEQESLSSILGEESMSDPALATTVLRRNLILDNGLGDEDGNPKIIFLSNVGHSRRSLNQVFARALPLLTERGTDHTLKIERREADLDMLRCMIGRVYRPCWQS